MPAFAGRGGFYSAFEAAPIELDQTGQQEGDYLGHQTNGSMALAASPWSRRMWRKGKFQWHSRASLSL